MRKEKIYEAWIDTGEEYNRVDTKENLMLDCGISEEDFNQALTDEGLPLNEFNSDFFEGQLFIYDVDELRWKWCNIVMG